MLDKNQLKYFMSNPQSLSLEDIMLLENTAKNYPYFQLCYTLIAKGIFIKAPEIAQETISKAAIYALSRNALRKVIENDMDWNWNYNTKQNEMNPNLSHNNLSDELHREKHEEELIVSIAKPALRNIQEEQLAIINQFIKSEPRIQPVNSRDILEEVEDLSTKSTTLADPLITESYAIILVRQGKFKKAIEVYYKLMTKNPEKNAYFAGKIADLQKKII